MRRKERIRRIGRREEVWKRERARWEAGEKEVGRERMAGRLYPCAAARPWLMKDRGEEGERNGEDRNVISAGLLDQPSVVDM